jgi:hypothetical protein
MFTDARMLKTGQVEITPSVSPGFVSADGETEHAWTDFGVRGQFGVTDRINVGFGYNRTQLSIENPDTYGFNTVAFGPKFSLMPDRLALAVPVSVFFAEDLNQDERWQLHPTLLMTVPLSERVDFNPAVRLRIPVCDNCDTSIAFHAGFGFRTGRHLILRPEAVAIVNPGDDGVSWTFGLGASIR